LRNTPVFVVNRDLLTWPKALVEQLRLWGMSNITIVDNASTYEPLLEWYASGEVEVIRLDENLGPRAVWLSGLHETADDLYVVTDSDISLAELGPESLELLLKGLVQYPLIRKAGLGLRPPKFHLADGEDLTAQDRRIVELEGAWRSAALDEEFYSAPVDTTFALYSRSRDHIEFYRAIRTRAPYEAVHLPWTDAIKEIESEYRYYAEHAALRGFAGLVAAEEEQCA